MARGHLFWGLPSLNDSTDFVKLVNAVAKDGNKLWHFTISANNVSFEIANFEIAKQAMEKTTPKADQKGELLIRFWCEEKREIITNCVHENFALSVGSS